MKLTERTIPQAKNYQCDVCKGFRCHKDMQNNDICYDCYSEIEKEKADEKQALAEVKKELWDTGMVHN